MLTLQAIEDSHVQLKELVALIPEMRTAQNVTTQLANSITSARYGIIASAQLCNFPSMKEKLSPKK